MKKTYDKKLLIIGIIIMLVFVIPCFGVGISFLIDGSVGGGIGCIILFVFLTNFVSNIFFRSNEAKLLAKEKKLIDQSRKNAKKGLESYIDSLIVGKSLNPEFIPDIIKEADKFGISDEYSSDKLYSRFAKNIEYWNADNGRLSELPADFIMQKDEKCVFRDLRCSLYEDRTVTNRVNYGGVRGRVKIAKGLSYNIGSYGVSTSKSTSSTLIAVGKFNITNKRVLFGSGLKNVTIPLTSIIDVEPYTDAVVISKSSGKPQTFHVRDGILCFKILNSIINSDGSLELLSAENNDSFVSFDDEIRQIIREKGKLSAVQYYKNSTGSGLSEAKSYIDSL